jgi:hypothetical protein
MILKTVQKRKRPKRVRLTQVGKSNASERFAGVWFIERRISPQEDESDLLARSADDID